MELRSNWKLHLPEEGGTHRGGSTRENEQHSG